jgi:Uri superfamily endonuclease
LTTLPDSRSGTYILWLSLEVGTALRVGQLGLIAFDPGVYAYVGSAFGPGGVRSRVGRHCKKDKKLRWHIDYLRRICEVSAAWASYERDCQEHHWFNIMKELPGARVPVTGFGCSDCRCLTHLVWFSQRPPLGLFHDRLGCRPGSITEISPICE